MKIIHILLLGMACLSCSSVNTYTLNGILPEDCNVTEIYLVSQEGKGADTLARCPVGSDKSFKLKGKSENRLLYLNVGSRGGRILFLPGIRCLSFEKNGRRVSGCGGGTTKYTV